MGSRARLRNITTGVVSLVALVVLAAGVPIALWTFVGWPLPASLPSLGDIGQALSRNQISDATVFKAVALLGWIAWLQIAASTLVETVAWARGRAAPRLRFAGAAQPTMGKLIASAALVLATAHLPNSTSPTPRLHQRPASYLRVEMPTAFVVRTEAGLHDDVTRLPAQQTTSYTVVRYDTLWGIAQSRLGDPLRWRDIFELNRGRPQPNGRTLEEPQLIMPGWVLTLPANPTGQRVPPEPTPPRRITQTHTSRHGLRPDPVEHSQPAATRPIPAVIARPAPSTAPDVAAAPADVRHHTHEHQAQRDVDPALLIGGGLSAASLVVLVDRLRRVQRRRRGAGRQFSASDPTLDHVERRLRRAADLDGAELLDLALRAFAAGTTQNSSSPATILAVRVGGGQVEILSEDPPEHSPPGFVATDDARGWITDPELSVDDLREIGAGTAAPLPALVALGDIDGDRLLIDIESAGTLTVDGPANQVSAYIRRVAVELATSTWADHVDVLSVGALELDIAGAQRVQHFSDIDAALDELDAAARNIAEALAAAQCSRTLEARLAEYPDDGWIPTILVCAEPIGLDVLARIRKITGDGGCGTGAVVSCDVPSVWHASLGDTDLVLSPLGLHVAPALLDFPTAAAIDALVTDLAVGEPIIAAAAVAPADETPTDPDITEPYVDPPFEVEVRVLGPVEIVGSRVALGRRECVELATYLALHPNGASDERLITALWPDRTPARSTFNTAVSTTRSRLGRASDSTPHFPRNAATGGTYQLGPLVITDFARFTARVAHTRRCVPSAAAETLRSAMDLVRGKPFDNPRGYEWAYSESLIAHIEATIADAAHQLAQLCLDAGDADEAISVAIRGLVAAPGDEILYRDRMLACDLAGNPAGVETVMDELCEFVEALEPYDELHAETLSLYERISHRKRTRTLDIRQTHHR
ncbi:MAG: BTAD domain-containing putative transcriptional regulator [Acidimicrobiia bacterium]